MFGFKTPQSDSDMSRDSPPPHVDSGNGWYQCDDHNITLIRNVPYDDAYITFDIAE